MVEGAKSISKLSEIKNITKDSITCISDKTIYNVGETANILVQSPYPDEESEGMYEISTDSVCSVNRFKIKNDFTISIPIKKEFIPNINIYIYIVGKEKRIDDNGNILTNIPKRPAFASTQLSIGVTKITYGLNVKIQPKKQYSKPSDENEVEVEIKDFEGKLVKNSEVTLMVVDEAVLSLTGLII
jgi:alpha-2-macroglobulin